MPFTTVEAQQAYNKAYHLANKEKRSAYQKEYRRLHPEKRSQQTRRSHLKSKFGLTEEAFEALLESQGRCGACCGTSTPGGTGAFHVDHCHSTGKIRGLLCQQCNTGIGKLGDSIEGLERALAYLRQST